MTQDPGRRTQDAAKGTVHLVGAGPGDPGLLTLRAAELIASCDCVVHDYLVNPDILARAPATAMRIDVGKRGYAGSVSQDEINARLVECAQRFRCVVRLKGGDPFLFGRGGEEADHLAAAGVPFTVVPGVTSGIAVPAYAGIPITHRAKSSAVVFATGHRRPGADDEEHWRALAHIETIVLYMGMQKLGDLTAAIIRHGRTPTTPACVIQWGTYGRQRTCTSTVADIAERAAAEGLGAPAITVIGEVCAYRERIRWFDSRRLSGRRVLVTRARAQASALASRLDALGAEVVELPLARFAEPESWQPLHSAMADATATWWAFTSVNAVEAWWRQLRASGHDARQLAGTSLAAVGAATAGALERCGLHADVIAPGGSADSLAEALITHRQPTHVVLPQADNARPVLATRLRAAGWQVTTVTVYRTVALEQPAIERVERLDAATFASAATAARFIAAVPAAHVAAILAAGCRCYAIGPETAAGMQRVGLPVHGIADVADTAALADLVAADLGPADLGNHVP